MSLARVRLKLTFALPLLFIGGGGATSAPTRPATAQRSPQVPLTTLADAFVPLVLEIGTFEPDFVDA